jgi:ATP-dependent Clp protease ATP-binding subunit ClpC
MVIAGLLILSLLCVGALWFALFRFDRRGASHEHLERELARLRAELEEEKRRRVQAALPAPPAAGGASDNANTSAGEADASTNDEVTPRADARHAVPETAGELDALALAWSLDEFFNATTHPRELLANETFVKGVELLRAGEHTVEDLLAYAVSPPYALACMALEALARREDAPEDTAERLISFANDVWIWQRFYLLRALDRQARRPVLMPLIAQLNASWRDPIIMPELRHFALLRVASGDAITLEGLVAEVTSRGQDAAETQLILNDLGGMLPPALRREFESWRAAHEPPEFANGVGRVWEPGEGDDVVLLDEVAARVAELEAAVKHDPPRSVLLVGDSGVGKTALVRALARRLQKERWTVFEAGAADVLAGQQYIGQLEGRVREIVSGIGGKRVLWVVPNFHETLWAGQHQLSPVGVLDLLLPSIERGEVKIIGEVPSRAYEQLLRLRPKLRTALQTCRVAPLGDAETLELGRRWAARHARGGGAEGASRAAPRPLVSERTLREAQQLAKQYLGDKAAPGNLITFLEAARQRLSADGGGADKELTLDDLLVTLSQLTGLPVSILDEREGLDLAELRAFFEQRVLGQPEAVECLVERVAMIKAGLTDPTRPQGVFLFVGPTGTGKTEIAKTLAEFLFGSHERMIRLDMSEFQTPDALERILGEARETTDTTALVNLIRKQPFSVVLLDEFEKAHPQVWDLFLQVFDDGRLTDRRGNTADFRHCVVILTSNLGATLPHGASIGFSQEQAQFAAGSVERAVTRTFRREFVNRIDRVVVFRPLGRAVMRDLLRKELNDALRRRGLRTRQWAVEWDDSAVEFLLEKGFTADLGARPLKRAVERYLLAPLALTIVNHQFPEGDQFLFVRSAPDGQSLGVQFVDPDAPEQVEPAPSQVSEGLARTFEPEEVEAPAVGEAELRLEAIALDARGTPEEVRFLQRKFDALADRADEDEWRQRKEAALQETQAPGFWTSPERFSVLGLAEYMDRVEAGLDTAGSLLARLRGQRKRLPPELVARVAERLYLLDAACRGLAAGEPRDAFIRLSAEREAGADGETGDEFARRLAEMYRRWAEKRRMRFKVLAEHDGETAEGARAEGYRLLAAVSGYAAFPILRPETGLHVLETPQDEKSFNRTRVRVQVAAQPDEPAGHGPDALRRQAERALDDDGAAAPQQIVRRYREQPSPDRKSVV